MNAELLPALLGVLSVWGIVSFSIWRMGPGRIRRTVQCPEKQIRARVLIEQREGDFGRLRAADALACSLATGTPLACGKECLTHL